MRYVISNIHGCYDKYKLLLRKLRFSSKDHLYVLGDCVDYGLESIQLLEDLMERKNVTLLLGEHEYLMFMALNKLTVNVTADNINELFETEELADYKAWMKAGGVITASEFAKLTKGKQKKVLQYLLKSPTHEVIKEKDQTYVLAHGGINNYDPKKELSSYNHEDFIFATTDYSKNFFQEENMILMTGHKPTVLIREDKKHAIHKSNGHIAVDCGCVFGGRLGAYCIENGKSIYV